VFDCSSPNADLLTRDPVSVAGVLAVVFVGAIVVVICDKRGNRFRSLCGTIIPRPPEVFDLSGGSDASEMKSPNSAR